MSNKYMNYDQYLIWITNNNNSFTMFVSKLKITNIPNYPIIWLMPKLSTWISTYLYFIIIVYAKHKHKLSIPNISIFQFNSNSIWFTSTIKSINSQFYYNKWCKSITHIQIHRNNDRSIVYQQINKLFHSPGFCPNSLMVWNKSPFRFCPNLLLSLK